MKLSYQWLSDYVDLEGVAPDELAEKLTSAGLEVEAVLSRNQGVCGVVVGQVTAWEKHPNADRLKVCTVDVGTGEFLTIVCGASNVEEGMRVPVATVGAQLPGGSIGKAKLRGIESHGMLCSAKEIGLETKLLPKEQTEGLYVLPADAPIGRDIVSFLSLDDTVLEIGLTPNRSDCLSIRGFAYEVGALLNRPVRFEPVDAPSAAASSTPVAIRIDSDRCPRYEAQVIQGLEGGSSPLWMQMRLMAMGVRPISLIVDVTNYVMLEWGQPLHAFDFDQVQDGMIVVRQARAGERLVTLDGNERTLTEEMIVIADPRRAIGLAGVMGGENSEVTAGTHQIVLESAVFDARSVRRTGQALGLRSEAQQRFEKGVDPVAVRQALCRATQLLQDLGGGIVVGECAAAGNGMDRVQTTVEFSPARCNALLGTEIPTTDMSNIFQRLGFSVEMGEGTWSVRIPTRRMDITREADLVEEVARLYGYEAIPSTLPQGATTPGVRSATQILRKRTREVLVSSGLYEVYTYALTQPADIDQLRVDADSPLRLQIPLLLPMSEERSTLRTVMLPSLASVATYNLARDIPGGSIFEVGKVYLPQALPLTEQPREQTQWAGLWFGSRESSMWETSTPYDFYDAKGVVETWLEAFGWLPDVEFVSTNVPWLHPGRSAAVQLRGQTIGFFGELHPETAQSLDLPRAVYAEMWLDGLSAELEDRWRVARLPRYPASRRDLAVLVPIQETVGSLLRTAWEAARQGDEELLEDCQVFDVYMGKGVPDGQKSLAFALTIRSAERTLTDEEITAVQQRILEAWLQRHGAVLRSV